MSIFDDVVAIPDASRTLCVMSCVWMHCKLSLNTTCVVCLALALTAKFCVAFAAGTALIVGAPDVGDTPGGAGSFPADDEPVRASRRTYAPRVTAPGDGSQAANGTLAGAWGIIVSKSVIRSSRCPRPRMPGLTSVDRER